MQHLVCVRGVCARTVLLYFVCESGKRHFCRARLDYSTVDEDKKHAIMIEKQYVFPQHMVLGVSCIQIGT